MTSLEAFRTHIFFKKNIYSKCIYMDIKEYRKLYYLKNREKFLERSRKRYNENSSEHNSCVSGIATSGVNKRKYNRTDIKASDRKDYSRQYHYIRKEILKYGKPYYYAMNEKRIKGRMTAIKPEPVKIKYGSLTVEF